MIKPSCIGFALGCSAMLVAGCGGGNEAKDPVPAAKIEPAAKAEMKEVWLHVDGMTERLKIV
jgi:hypothetical protein